MPAAGNSRLPPDTAWSRRDSIWLAAILSFAALLRAAFYTGFFGSDEMLYLKAAQHIVEGVWQPSDYIGDQRYGVNLPMASFLQVFGRGEAAAAAWAFLCSLMEVALVFMAGRMLWQRRAGVAAALLLASLPIHVHMAGRLMADAPLTAFMTLAFLLFWLAERHPGIVLYLLAGLAGGFVFWIKEVTIIFLVLFLPLAFLLRPWNPQRLAFPLGVMVMIVGNCLLMGQVNGDPLHVFKIVHGRVNEVYVGSNAFRTDPGYYFQYLFLKIQHTGLLAFLALGGFLVWLRRDRLAPTDTAYVVIWALGMLLLFSWFVVSFSPFMWISKQSNYLTLFAAPLCLLAGHGLASLSRTPRWALGGAAIAAGILLSALEQAAAQADTANLRGMVLYAAAHPGASLYGPVRAEKAWAYQARLAKDWDTPVVRRYDGLSHQNIDHYPAYVMWPNAAARGEGRRPDSPPACWQPLGTLEPAPSGAGGHLAAGLLELAGYVPGSLSERLTGHLAGLSRPAPATLYAIPSGCHFNLAGM